MALQDFVDELKKGMDSEVEQISLNQEESIIRTSQLVACLKKYLCELKGFVIKYKYRSVDEEIKFFKFTKPYFASHLFFYKNLFNLQLSDSYYSPAAKVKLFQERLRKAACYIRQHKALYSYMLLKLTFLDESYFTCKNNCFVNPSIDHRFSTKHEIQYSRILGYEKLKQYLINSIQKIEAPSSVAGSNLSWTGSKTDL